MVCRSSIYPQRCIVVWNVLTLSSWGDLSGRPMLQSGVPAENMTFDAFTTHNAYFERSIMQQCSSHWYHPTPCCTLKWVLAIERRALSSENNSLISFSFRVSKNKSHIVIWSGWNSKPKLFLLLELKITSLQLFTLNIFSQPVMKQ